MYFIRSRKNTETTNVIAQKRAAIYEIEVGVNFLDRYQEPIASAPPLSSPLYNAIDASMAAGQEVPLSFEGKSTPSAPPLSPFDMSAGQRIRLPPILQSIPEVMYSCECCLDFKLPVEKGVLCSNVDRPHFICNCENNDCFSTMITAQTNDQATFMKNGNYIVCAYCLALDSSVVIPFDQVRVAKHANPVALAAYKRAISESVNAAPVCMICMENPKVIALLPCGHKAYCAECFVDPMLSQGNCPYC
jgi:hypothetical protein